MVSAMTRWVLVVAALVLGGVGSALGQPEDKPDPTLDDAIRLRSLAQAAMLYAQKHKWEMPADLFDAFQGAAGGGNLRAAALRGAVSPAHEGLLHVPEVVTREWVNEGSSYRYLGSAGISMESVQNWSDIVIMHLRLDKGHAVAPSALNPTGEVFSLAFFDGHVELLPRAEAERRIDESMRVLDALRTGGEAPPKWQVAHDMGMIMRAVRAYAKAHDGSLPPDLGATLAFMPSDTPATATPAKRARIYLSPGARRDTTPPDEPTAEWVNARCSYVYLGSASLRLEDIPEPASLVLISARPADSITELAIDGTKREWLAVATVEGLAATRDRAYSDWIIEESRKVFRALREGEAVPAWVQAGCDVRLLGDAVLAFAKAHDGALPTELAETIGYLPEHPRLPGRGGLAGVYISPRSEWGTEFPASPSAEWVRAHSDYVLVTGGPRTLGELRERGIGVLVHGPLTDGMNVRLPMAGEMDVAPYYSAFGWSSLMPREWLKKEVEEARSRLAEAAKGPPEKE